MPPKNTLAQYIPVVRLLESLGGSEGYEKDPTSYGNALKKQLTGIVSGDDEVAVGLFGLLKGPINLEGGHKVTMTSLLRGVERLGGSKSFEEHVRKLGASELQVNQAGPSTSHGRKRPENVEDPTSSGLGIIVGYRYSNYAHMSCWTLIIYVSVEITANIHGTTYIMNGHVWGLGGSFSFYEAGTLNYNNALAGNPGLHGEVGLSLNGFTMPLGIMVATTYKDGSDYANFVGVAGVSIGVEFSVTGCGIWTHD